MRSPLSEQEIVDRACERDAVYGRWFAIGVFVLLAMMALWLPVHTWLRLHREFLWGVLAGSLLQVPGWLRDRWRWMKWFSHQ